MKGESRKDTCSPTGTWEKGAHQIILPGLQGKSHIHVMIKREGGVISSGGSGAAAQLGLGLADTCPFPDAPLLTGLAARRDGDKPPDNTGGRLQGRGPTRPLIHLREGGEELPNQHSLQASIVHTLPQPSATGEPGSKTMAHKSCSFLQDPP